MIYERICSYLLADLEIFIFTCPIFGNINSDLFTLEEYFQNLLTGNNRQQGRPRTGGWGRQGC